MVYCQYCKIEVEKNHFVETKKGVFVCGRRIDDDNQKRYEMETIETQERSFWVD